MDSRERPTIDCQSEEGVTIGLIDSLMSIAAVVFDRTGESVPPDTLAIREALADLRSNWQLRALLGVDYEPLPLRTFEEMLVLTERLRLIRTTERSKEQDGRLAVLDKLVEDMSVHPKSTQDFTDLVMSVARSEKAAK